MQDILNGLLVLANVPIATMPDPARLRPADIAVSVGDSAKLSSATGWQPTISLTQTLRDTLDWWREQG